MDSNTSVVTITLTQEETAILDFVVEHDGFESRECYLKLFGLKHAREKFDVVNFAGYNAHSSG